MRSEDLNDQIEERYGNPETFVFRVRQALWDNRIKQSSLAKESGYPASSVNRWLNLRVVPTVKVMLILDEALERLLED